MQTPIRFCLNNSFFKHGFSAAVCGTLMMTGAVAHAQSLPRLLPGTQPLATLLPSLSGGGGDSGAQSRGTGTGTGTSAGLPLLNGLLGGGSQSGNRMSTQVDSLGQPRGLLSGALAPLPGLDNSQGRNESNRSARSGFGSTNNEGVDGNRSEEGDFRFSRRDEFSSDRVRLGRQSEDSGDESSGSERRRLNASGFNAIDFQSSRTGRSESNEGEERSSDSSRQASLQLDSGLEVTGRAEGESSSDNESSRSSDSQGALAISSSMTIERGSSRSSRTESNGSNSANGSGSNN